MVLLDANENAFGPALVLQNESLFNDISSASTNISKKPGIDFININRYPDPYAPRPYTIGCLAILILC